MISCFHRINQLKRSGRTIAAMMQQERNRGLLLDVDVKNSDFFTTQLNLAKTNKLLKDEMYVYNMLNEDAIEKLRKLFSKSYRRQNFLCDQTSYGIEINFNTFLKISLMGKGYLLVCWVAKIQAIVMEEMERLEKNVFLVDLRRNSDILISLVENLFERQLRFDNVKNVVSQADYLEIIDALIKKPAALAYLLQELSTCFEGITLIVDEANIALTITDSTTEAKIVAAKEALAILTRLTKQKKAVR